MAATTRTINWVIQEIGETQKTDFEKEINKVMDQTDKEKEIAEAIKRFFDNKYAPNWHCVVGKNFASYVTYQCKNYIFCNIGQHAILLYKQ